MLQGSDLCRLHRIAGSVLAKAREKIAAMPEDKRAALLAAEPAEFAALTAL